MTTHTLAEVTRRDLVDDLTYCDKCKKLLNMNLGIEGRGELAHTHKCESHLYFRVMDSAEGDLETYHYCEDCIDDVIHDLLQRKYVDLDISSTEGIVITDAPATKAYEERTQKCTEPDPTSTRERFITKMLEDTLKSEEDRYNAMFNK